MSQECLPTLEVWLPQKAMDELQLEVGQQPFTIGRKPSCSLVLLDPRVSGEHLSFSCSEGGIVIACDTSSNGSFLNGKRLEKQQLTQLSNGDVLSVVVPVKATPANLDSKKRDTLIATFVCRSLTHAHTEVSSPTSAVGSILTAQKADCQTRAADPLTPSSSMAGPAKSPMRSPGGGRPVAKSSGGGSGLVSSGGGSCNGSSGGAGGSGGGDSCGGAGAASCGSHERGGSALTSGHASGRPTGSRSGAQPDGHADVYATSRLRLADEATGLTVLSPSRLPSRPSPSLGRKRPRPKAAPRSREGSCEAAAATAGVVAPARTATSLSDVYRQLMVGRAEATSKPDKV